MQLHIEKDLSALSHELADWIRDYILQTLQKQDRFTWALSGGNTPKQLYELLATAPYREQIPWDKLHLFWGDERDVPYKDPRNNAKMTYDMLLDHVPVAATQVHIMRTDIPPEQSAAEYAKILHQYFDHTVTSFDLVLLGMGDDGHTLSLFPGTSIIHETETWTNAYYLPAQEMYRISLTTPVVNRAARIAFLASGNNKAIALKEVLQGTFDPDKFPSQIIQPRSGELHWFVDEAAAADLKL